MKRYFILTLISLYTVSSYSQFEYKMGINLSSGSFKTFGYATGADDYTPNQMPHYMPGIMVDGGLQFNINRRLSLVLGSNIMYSWKWSYKIDGADWMYYEVLDTNTYEVLTSGMNELKFFNFNIGITPKYYLSPGARWNPYIFTGINLNFTKAYYANNQWYDEKQYGYIPPEENDPYNPYLEHNVGIGLIPGFGIEYSTGSKYSFALETGYSLIFMKEGNFENTDNTENFNAIFFRIGIRFNFLKSKNL